ncbi:MAG: sugar phosphate isomerase/epimerase [Firmicutes bacterium]|nr:sugar phosphate isomerase/epimerase [Bacillota bacterium]
MVKISGFYDEAFGNINKQIKLIKELNEEYICLRGISGKNITDFTAEEFKQTVSPLLAQNGIKISSLGTGIGKIGVYDDLGYEKQLKKLGEMIKIAKDNDCKFIRIFSFFTGSEGGKMHGFKEAEAGNLSENAYIEMLPVVLKKLSGFLDLVKGTDIILLHENEKGIYGDTPARCLEILNALNCDNFKQAYDSSNFVQSGVNALEAYHELKDYIAYVHIKDCSPEKIEVPLGLGEGFYKEILTDLIKNRGYDGFLTLEPHTFKYALYKTFLRIPFRGGKAVFKRIDKAYNKKPLQTAGLKEVFLWQYYALKEMID